MLIMLLPLQAKADFWGGDLPLLAEIVFNTLHTMQELERQSNYMDDELAGIRDRLDRIRTISELVKPTTWEQWREPQEALRRLRLIYHNIPNEYRSEKYNAIEAELAQAMSLIARTERDVKSTFDSGKEIEARANSASPGVSQKLTASGVGTLVAMSAQSQVLQSQIAGLLAQMFASANEKETRSIVATGTSLKSISLQLRQNENRFSKIVFGRDLR